MATTRLTGTLIKSGSIPVTALGGGVVTSSAQIAGLVPSGTISSSAQFPGWVTSSGQVDITATTGYSTFSSSLATVDTSQTTRIDNLASVTSSYALQTQLQGVASSSSQVKDYLPTDTVSSSAQVDITATTNYGTFSSSLATVDQNQQSQIGALIASTSSYALQTQLQGVASSSSQVKDYLPSNTVSGSLQVDITQTTGYSAFSSSLATVDAEQTTRIDNLASATSSYALQSQLAGVVSSSTQVQPLLPANTVSSSGQVDITATTGYSTFSSSLATTDATQQTSINALNSATSSYAINATIQSQLAGVVSSSTQVQPLLPGGTVSSSGQVDYNSIQNKLSDVVSSSVQVKSLLPENTVSSSGQVDITATTGYSTFSSSLAIVDAGQTTRIDNLSSATSSYAIDATIQSQLAGVVSSSTQVQPLLPGGTISSSGQVVVQNTTGIGALATTGSNTFTANQTITGSLFISQNLTVLGSSSISFISQSTLDIGTSVITVNTLSPGTRFGGLSVIDSGSSPRVSGSIFFDSLKDEWIFIHQQAVGAGVTSSLFLMGPQTFDNIGNETNLTTNKIPKSQNAEHLSDSQISDDGVTVSITNGLTVGTNLTASNATISGLTANQAVFTDANDTLVSVATTGTGDVVRAGSPTITGTLTATNITATGTMLLAGILSSSTQVDYNSIQNKLSGVVSSSTQVQPLLPGGTVSSSDQVSITGTSGYSTFSSSIATKNDVQDVSINALNSATSSYAINATIQGQLAGVVSSSAQVKPLLPENTVSSSGQIDITATTSYSTFSSSIATKNDVQDVSISALNAATSSYALQTQLAGVASSSAQVQAYLPNGTVSSSGQVDITATTNYTTFSSSLATVDQNQQTEINALIASTSSYALQSQLAGVASSSSQVQAYLPNGTVSSSTQVTAFLPVGTVSSSGQVDITATTGYSTFSSSLATVDAGQTTRIDNLASLTSSYAINATIQSQLAGVVSSSTQVKPLLPADTVTSSTQVKTFLPGGTVSSSNQVDITATTGYSTFSSSLATIDATQQTSINALNAATSSYAINATIQSQLAGVASSSAQVKAYLPDGTVSASAQYPGWVTASSQIVWSSVNYNTGIVSSSTQVKPLLPGGTVSSSAQVILNAVTGTTFSNNSFYFPLDLRVDGTLTAQQINTEFVSSSVIFESGSSKFGDTNDDVMSVTGSIRVLGGSISGSMTGMFSSSAQVDYNSITNKLSGVVSSSAQVQPLLPAGTVSSSAQFPGWVTASSQIVWSSVNYNSGIVSSSAQVKPLLPGGTVSSSGQVDITVTTGYSTFSSSLATVDATQQVSLNALNAATSSYAVNSTIQSQLAGVVSSSTQVKPLLPGGTVSSSVQVDYNSITNKLSGVFSSSAITAPSQGTVRLTLNGNALTDVDTGLQADDKPLFSGSQFSGIVSGSGTQYRLVVPVGTNLYAT